MKILLLNEDEFESIKSEDILESNFIVIKKQENLFKIIKNRYGTNYVEVDKLGLEYHLKYDILKHFWINKHN